MASQSGKLLDNLLLIPTMNVLTGEFAALHRVFPFMDRETGRYPKGWFSGTSGGVFPVAGDVQRGPVVCAEGISTALALYDLFVDDLNEPATTVISCMDSGNMARLAPSIRKKFTGRKIFVSADNDDAGAKSAEACVTAGFDGVFAFAPPGGEKGAARDGV
jgi:phage/plasmid primase-like uncharacterized protein